MNGDARLYRNRDRALLGGVFAGAADYLRIPVILLRLFSLPLFVTPLLPFAAIAYLIAVFSIPARPRDSAPDPDHEAFRDAVTRSPSTTFGQVRHRLRDVEHRIRRLEAYVTSPDFDFDEELRRR